jgi:Skp family chaperone for outer membrane proteins
MSKALKTTSLMTALVLVTLSLFGANASLAQEAPIKIAVVNLDYIVAQSPAGRSLQDKLQSFEKEVRGEVEARTQAARALRQRLIEGANSLADDKLSEMQKELEDATISIRRYRDDKERQGQKMQQEGLKEIEKQLEPVFEKVRESGQYDLILNNVPGVVVMAGPRADITQKVLDALNAGG